MLYIANYKNEYKYYMLKTAISINNIFLFLQNIYFRISKQKQKPLNAAITNNQ